MLPSTEIEGPLSAISAIYVETFAVETSESKTQMSLTCVPTIGKF